MIVTQLTGGLGNQMFQYALGRALSLKHGTGLLFDTRPFDYQQYSDTKRSYELYVFDLPGRVANESELKKWGIPNRFKVLINRYLKLGLDPYPKYYLKERGHRFQREILMCPDNHYLSGFWQSEKYFKRIRSTIITDFEGREKKISRLNKSLADRINSTESVSIHVRRTDYVTNSSAKVYHGVCSIQYYKKAMNHVEKKVKKPVYFVFSDDPVWAKDNIKSRHKTIYISHNRGREAHEDIRLMSQCQHNIIANSSFSWWGAWLNQNKDKIVIAPKKWFADKSVDSSDLIPEKWKRI